MTSQNDLPDVELTGSHYRRRSLHDELGLAVDLSDSPDLSLGGPRSGPTPNGSRTSSSTAVPPVDYGTRGTSADETERFIESLRADDPEIDTLWNGDGRGRRGRHADPSIDDLVEEDYPALRRDDLPRFDGHDDLLDPAAEPYHASNGDADVISSPDIRAFGDLPQQRDTPDDGGQRPEPPPAKPTSAQLTADHVLRRRAELPARGWRRAVYAMTGGQINPGPSKAEIRERELVDRARRSLRGCHRLAVISLKGGVGKTTTTACLGSMFATLRGDRVIAMDANPDRGTLGEKIPRTSARTVRDLVNNAALLARYAEVREFTSQAPSRLEVLASDADPLVSMAFSETDYRIGVGILESYYNLILTDCGTGLLHSAMVGVLGLADSLIVVSSASLDGARSASATLDWLEHHGYHSLVRSSVAVISTVHPNGGNVDVGKLEDHFAARCRAVVRIPFDPHLEAGGVIDLDELQRPTYDAYLRLAAEVADGFDSAPRLG